MTAHGPAPLTPSAAPPFRTVVVVNPNSSNGKTGRRFPEIEAAITRALGATPAVFHTTGPGMATRLTRQALRDGFEMVVAVGGDGTNNEVLNGFFDEDGAPIAPTAVLGIMPSGTGGDFRRSHGWSRDFAENAARLAGRTTRRIDVGVARFVAHNAVPAGSLVTRYFINITSFGIGGLVDSYVNRSTKAFGGKVSFLLGTLRAVARYRNQTIRVRFDDGPEESLTVNNLAVANGQFFGGGMHVAPGAAMDDGLFDVVTFGNLSKSEFLSLSGSIYRGTHMSHPKLSLRRARVVHAESDDVVLIDMDGEQPGRLPITLSVVPGAILLKV